MEDLLPRRDGLPSFYVVLLGVGSDGHILSTFPGTAPVTEERRAVMAVEAPTHIEPHVARVTLAPSTSCEPPAWSSSWSLVPPRRAS